MASKRILVFILSALLLLSLGWTLDIWRGLQGGQTPLAEQTVSRPREPRINPDPAQEKRHIRLQEGQLFVYAGPLGGQGELLRVLDIPLNALPPRWLAQLTNDGLEFADEETLLMALDNLDELIK